MSTLFIPWKYSEPRRFCLTQNLWYIQDSIYAVTNKSGIFEFGIGTRTIIQHKHTDIYPTTNVLRDICSVNYENNIFIIDPHQGEIIKFNTSTKEFETKLKFYRSNGFMPSVAVVDNFIHIFLFQSMMKRSYYVYSIDYNVITLVKKEILHSQYYYNSMFSYKNKIIDFGGSFTYKIRSNFMYSSIIKGTNFHHIKWNKNKKCFINNGCWECGYIVFENYVIRFGGYTMDGFSDAISILDLNDSDGLWSKAQLYCPQPNKYIAALDITNQNVHLFKHLSIPQR